MSQKLALSQIVDRIDRLPEIPQAVLKVYQMIEDPEVTAEALAGVIQVDPALTAQILRLCNSASYGFARTIETVQQAIALLGMSALKSLVYVVLSKHALDTPLKGYGLDKGDLWENALTGAVFARFLAQHHQLLDPELAFTAALLRDIGKLALSDFVGPSYRHIEQMAHEHKTGFEQAEEETLGYSHTAVGCQIAQKWGLPDRIVQAIRYHHQPGLLWPNVVTQEQQSTATLVTLVHLADVFTMMLGSGIGQDGMMYVLDNQALEHLNIKLDAAYVERMIYQLMEQQHTVRAMAASI